MATETLEADSSMKEENGVADSKKEAPVSDDKEEEKAEDKPTKKRKKKSTPKTCTCCGESSDVPAKRRQTKKPGKKQEESSGELERTNKRKSDGFFVNIQAQQLHEEISAEIDEQHSQSSSCGNSVQSWSVTQQFAPCNKERIYGMNAIQDINEASSSAPPLPPPQLPEDYLQTKEHIDALNAKIADLDASTAYLNEMYRRYDPVFDILAKDNPKLASALKAQRAKRLEISCDLEMTKAMVQALTVDNQSSDVPAKRMQTKKPVKKQEESSPELPFLGVLERTHEEIAVENSQLSASGSSVQSWSVTQTQMDESAPCKKERIYGMNSIQDINEATSSAPPLPTPQLPEEYLQMKEQVDTLTAKIANLKVQNAYLKEKYREYEALLDILTKDDPKLASCEVSRELK